MQKLKHKLRHLFDEVDIASIIVFRIFFGAIMLWEVWRYFDKNWIYTYWIKPKYHFPHWPFLSLEPLEGDGMYYLFYLMGLLSVFIIIGLFYRISIVLFFLSFTYMFLLEQTRYLNHFYLVALLSFVMMFIPASRSFSIDALLFRKMRKSYVSNWHLWLLRFMIAVPFFFGGVAKINSDWLVGEPLGTWLSRITDFPIIGKYFTEYWMVLIMAYSGLIIDLFIVPFLIIKRTRIWAFLIGTTFHLMNARLFNIGIFPWFMIAASTLFFDPDWPRQWINKLFRKEIWIQNKVLKLNDNPLNKKQKLITFGLGLWVFIMVFMPLRHFLIPGNASWTEEGHKYAWHMKLRTKRAMGLFYVKNKDGELMDIINVEQLMPYFQSRKVINRPPMIWQFAQKIKEEYKQKGQDVSVYADIESSLNARPPQQLTNPDIDIAAEPYPVWKADWILPLTTPLTKSSAKKEKIEKID
ncbi:HTTM domain-containing protein [Lacinutrix iliipiscaria]|uniref:HTTM domain-containing protein n=1 Tax=Lacinutrix iliipiscaria TaxID=1230532 RepID=A0ABW5WPB2_9FLAO